MTDTLFSDVSEYQVGVNNSYPHRFIAFRSNDGTYRDSKFAANLAWAKLAVAAGRIDGFVVYFVYEPNWQQTVATFKAMVGAPHPKMAVMIDVENWSGRITGNQSAAINASRESVITWLGGNRKRVFGYGNMADLANLWPSKGDSKVIVAAYGSNPSHPAKIAHQFADNIPTAPFGPSDMNSSDGNAPTVFATIIGVAAVPLPLNNVPRGFVDAFTSTDNKVYLRGWAFDPDVKASAITVRVYEDGKLLTAQAANVLRADVNKAYGLTGNHGYDFTIAGAVGTHTYQIIAMDAKPNQKNTVLGTKTLTLTAPPTPPGPPPVPTPPPPAPPVQPPAAPLGHDMILVRPDPATIPTGTANPGIFLLSSSLTLHHVLAPGSTNVLAYQRAGVPGPVVITYAEFLSFNPPVSPLVPVSEEPADIKPANLVDLEYVPGNNVTTT